MDSVVFMSFFNEWSIPDWSDTYTGPPQQTTILPGHQKSPNTQHLVDFDLSSSRDD
jgi:hypothetical protein